MRVCLGTSPSARLPSSLCAIVTSVLMMTCRLMVEVTLTYLLSLSGCADMCLCPYLSHPPRVSCFALHFPFSSSSDAPSSHFAITMYVSCLSLLTRILSLLGCSLAPSPTVIPQTLHCHPYPTAIAIHLLLSGWAMLCLRTDLYVVKPARALLYPASSSQSPPCADFHHQASLDRMHRPWSAIPWFGAVPPPIPASNHTSQPLPTF